MAKARRIRMPTAVKLPVNTEKGRLTRTPMAAPLQLNTGRARRIRMFTAAPLLPRMVKARITPAPMVTALRIIRQPLIMAIIRLPRSTTTDQHAPTATVGRLPPLSQPPLLPVRLWLQQMQTPPMPMLRPRQPTLTTLDTTPAQPRVNLPRPRQPWLDSRQLFHGADGWSAPGRLHYSHRPRDDLLFVWQHLVQRGLRRKRRLLSRGAWSRRLALQDGAADTAASTTVVARVSRAAR